jgi:hypothetical protein
MTVRELAIDVLHRWRLDPVAQVREDFGAEPDSFQVDALRAFASPKVERIAIKAAKGPGKTTVLAWMILNFLATRPHPKIAATSITGDNLDTNLWPEIAKWLNRSAWMRTAFEWTKTRVFNREEPENWFAVARTWPKKADPQQQAETLAGIHADYVLFVLDESGGIPQAVMATAEAVLASGRESKLVQAGNPTHTTGPLYRACTMDRRLWHVVTVTGDPDNPKRSARIKVEWAKQQIDSFGRDNPWVLVNVLGEFPPASLNALLGPEEVEAAMRRHLPETAYNWSQKRLGVDVARFGDDRTVIMPRQGLAAFRPRVIRHQRGSSVSVDIATAVAAAKTRWQSELELFDATGGWAAGAIDVLRASGYTPLDVQFAAPALDPRYANRRAELWFAMSEWIKSGAALPNMPDLLGELITPTYTFVGGRFQLEPKDAVKARLGRSPDVSDALALTFGFPEMPQGTAEKLSQQSVGTTLHEFDPFKGAYSGS